MIGLLVLLFFLLPQNKKGKLHRITMGYAVFSAVVALVVWFMGYDTGGLWTLVSLLINAGIFYYVYNLREKQRARMVKQ